MANVIKDNLRRIRLARGMQQSDLADKLGVSEKTISNWECGVRDPSTANVFRLAEILDVPPSDLIGHINSNIDSTYSIIMQDDSMSPEIMPGDKLTISKAEQFKDGDLVEIEQKDSGSVIRRLFAYGSMVTLLAVKPSIAPINAPSNGITIKGKVIKLERKV